MRQETEWKIYAARNRKERSPSCALPMREKYVRKKVVIEGKKVLKRARAKKCCIAKKETHLIPKTGKRERKKRMKKKRKLIKKNGTQDRPKFCPKKKESGDGKR